MAAEENSNPPAESIKRVLRDESRPDEDTDFKWVRTQISDCCRFLLNGTKNSAVKIADLSAANIDVESSVNLVSGVVENGKGFELLNTVERFHSREVSVKVEPIIFTIAFCSCSENMTLKKKAYSLMSEICISSVPFLMFNSFREKISQHVYKSKGWGKAQRNAAEKWYQSKSGMEIARIVMAAPRHNKWSHCDVLRLAHITPRGKSDVALFSFIKSGLKECKKLQEESEEIPDETLKLLNFLEKIATVRSNQKVSDIVPIVKELELSWDFIPCHVHKEPELWTKLISIIPLEVMIRNTARMAKMKLFDSKTEVHAIFNKRCASEEDIKDSKINPYEILMIKALYTNAMRKPKRKPSWFVDQKISESLDTAYNLAMECNLVVTGKRYFVMIDASDSMKAHISGNDNIQCRVAAAFLSLCLAKVEPKVIVKAFSKEFADIDIKKLTTISEIVEKLDETALGGTDCSRPIIFAKGKKIKTDVFLVITDKETSSGKTSPAEALKQYRKKMKINAKLITLFLNPEANTRGVADPEDRGMLDIFGFSSSILKVIANFASYDF